MKLTALLAVLIVALALPAAVFAHPVDRGYGYCEFPNGVFKPSHCSSEDHANGGHDVHRPNPPGDGHGDGHHAHDCIVKHAATPAQLCPIADGLQYYFIGRDGSAEAGPYLPDLPDSTPAVQLFRGTNPLTGKFVTIDHQPHQHNLLVSTFYPDNEYDTDKPYIFTVDGNNEVIHVAW